MFSSLFQLEQKPVTVFRSSDTNAPILTQAAGSLKNLLKACLVEGYGDKPSLGWKIAHQSTDGLTVAFASQDTTASQYCLKIDNSDATVAKLSAAQQMTDIDTLVKPWINNQLYHLYGGNWTLVGHGKAFVLLLDRGFQGTNIAYPLLFGDLPRESKRTEPVCVVWTGRGNDGYHANGLQTTLFYNVNGKNDVSSGNTQIDASISYPFRIASNTGGDNLTANCCRFTYGSNLTATLLYEPVFSVLRDSTWTFLPMLMPVSAPFSGVRNLGSVSANAIAAVTGDSHYHPFLESCVVPTDWWYA